jgi:hypothetical protein
LPSWASRRRTAPIAAVDDPAPGGDVVPNGRRDQRVVHLHVNFPVSDLVQLLFSSGIIIVPTKLLFYQVLLHPEPDGNVKTTVAPVVIAETAAE